jgi:uncharacterized protein
VVGLFVGVVYGVIRVKSPAPPIVALIGLLGMVLGEQAGGWLLVTMMPINMFKDSMNAVEELLSPMLKKTQFVAINRVAAPASAIAPFVAEHLTYMNGLEAEGCLWASGPFIEDGVLAGDGLTILSTSTIEEARRAMEEEPLLKRGLRKFELRKWELREDWIDIQRRQVIGEGVHENINHVSKTVGLCREFDEHHGAFIGG